MDKKNETIFFNNLKKNKDKLEIYMNAIKEGKITNFDPTTITKLRRLYYGLFSGLLFMYMDPYDFSKIGDKLELLTHVFEDKDYSIVHGEIDSIHEINFEEYDVDDLKSNSWIEVVEGHKTWVYDIFSMMKFEKDVYYKLENPKINSVIPKDLIINHPGRDREDYQIYYDGFNEMLCLYFDRIEKDIDSHPFKEILRPEITRFKEEINYEEIEKRNPFK